MVEGGKDVGPAFVAHSDPVEACEPSERAFHDPAVSPELLAALDPAPGDPRDDRPLAQSFSAVSKIIALVGVQLVRPFARPADALADRWHGIHQLLQKLAVVAVGRRNPHGERNAVGVDENMALGARLSTIRRVRPALLALLFAGTAALSTRARSQLIAFA